MYGRELGSFYNSFEIYFNHRTQDGAIKWFLCPEPLKYQDEVKEVARARNWELSLSGSCRCQRALVFVGEYWLVLQDKPQALSVLRRLPELYGLPLCPLQTGLLPLMCPLMSSYSNKALLYCVVRYIEIESLRCKPKTNIALYVNSTLVRN